MTPAKLKALNELLKLKKVSQPEKGYFPRSYWQKEFQVSEKTANNKIRDLMKFGLMNMKYYKVKTGQVVRPVPHYKLISL